MQSEGNGEYRFILEFSKINNSNSKIVISTRPEIAIKINAFEFSYESWSNKICN